MEHIDFATTHVWPDNWLGFADYSPWMSNKAFDYTYGGGLIILHVTSTSFCSLFVPHLFIFVFHKS